MELVLKTSFWSIVPQSLPPLTKFDSIVKWKKYLNEKSIKISNFVAAIPEDDQGDEEQTPSNDVNMQNNASSPAE